MKRVAPSLLALLMLLLASCERSHLTDTPVERPVAPPVRPDVSGDVITLRVSAGADPAHLHLVLVRAHVDPREAEVVAHPSSSELTPLLGDLAHGTRIVVVLAPELAQGDAVAVLDALRQAGYTRFAVSR